MKKFLWILFYLLLIFIIVMGLLRYRRVNLLDEVIDIDELKDMDKIEMGI